MHAARAFWCIWGLASFQNDNKGQLPVTTAKLYVDLKSLPCHANNAFLIILIRFDTRIGTNWKEFVGWTTLPLIFVDHNNWWRHGTCGTQQMICHVWLIFTRPRRTKIGLSYWRRMEFTNYARLHRGRIVGQHCASWWPSTLSCWDTLRWCHKGHDSVSNRQHHHCLLNCYFGGSVWSIYTYTSGFLIGAKHYNNVIMHTMASQITSPMTV